jgi:hypothetical protein
MAKLFHEQVTVKSKFQDYPVKQEASVGPARSRIQSDKTLSPAQGLTERAPFVYSQEYRQYFVEVKEDFLQ